MLKFEPRWRFNPPPDERYKNTAIPREALWEFDGMIGKVATQGKRWGTSSSTSRAPSARPLAPATCKYDCGYNHITISVLAICLGPILYLKPNHSQFGFSHGHGDLERE
jgi:hypothetical protein